VALSPVNKEYNTFVRGLITEANPLTYPENASLDEDNFELKRDGSRSRRLGVDYESGYSLINSERTSDGIRILATHEWRGVNNDPDQGILVVQVNSDLWFFDLFSNDWTAAASQRNSGRPLTDTSIEWVFAASQSDLSGRKLAPFSTIVLNGDLIIAIGAQNVYRLSYDSSADSIEVTEISLKVRDQWGVDSGLSVTERPLQLSRFHKYNLLNQGWQFQFRPTEGSRGVDSWYLLGYYYSKEFEYPADNQNPHLAKNSEDRFSVPTLKAIDFGNTPAPKGRYVINLFNRGESRDELITNEMARFFGLTTVTGKPRWVAFTLKHINEGPYVPMPLDRTDGGVTVVGSFAGRIFYAGFTGETIGGDQRSPLLSTMVTFSRLAHTEQDLGKCYSEADPTSEDFSDVIDTDGGLIQIPEMGQCIKMVSLGRGLLLFSNNGVWEISGGESNFTATDFQVSRITEIGALSPNSIIEAEGSVYYWAKGGIYQLASDAVGQLAPQNISETTIQTLFNGIPSLNKQYVSGAYDPVAKKLQWLYSDDATLSPDGILTQYNKLLTLDLVLGSFSVKTFGSLATNSPVVTALAITPETIAGELLSAVTVGVDKVTENLAAEVVINATYAQNSVTRTKYLTLLPNTAPATSKFTFSHEQDSDFLDWKAADSVGIDAPAFMEAGYEILQDTQRDKYIQYLTTHFNRTDTNFTTTDGLNYTSDTPSGCLMEVKYGFTDSSSSGKWTAPTQAYRLNRNFIIDPFGDGLFDYGYNVVSTKHKVRGRGKAVRVKFSTEPGKDCQLLGWGAQYTGLTAI
jgi:hypothetical protein